MFIANGLGASCVIMRCFVKGGATKRTQDRQKSFLVGVSLSFFGIGVIDVNYRTIAVEIHVP